MIKQEYLHSDITEVIIGCAMQVHRAIGKGFQEHIYQRALMIELSKTKYHIEREKERPIYYDGQMIGKRRVDFLVNDNILVEIKAHSQFEAGHYNQIINYLEIFQLPIGLLINFGKDSLDFKRFTNNKMKTECFNHNHSNH